MTLNDLKTMVAQAGYRPSMGSWEDATSIHAFSIENHGPSFCGHSKFALTYRKDTGKVYHNNEIYEGN